MMGTEPGENTEADDGTSDAAARAPRRNKLRVTVAAVTGAVVLLGVGGIAWANMPDHDVAPVAEATADAARTVAADTCAADLSGLSDAIASAQVSLSAASGVDGVSTAALGADLANAYTLEWLRG